MSTTTTQGDTLAQYLTFGLADETYGVSVLRVREILKHETVTRVPGVPAFIRGVINLRGRVVPVVDLAARFGLTPSSVTPRTCVVIVEVAAAGETLVMGLLADAVNQVIELAPGEIEAPPSFGTRVEIGYLAGMGRIASGFVLLLDIDRILSPDEVLAVAATDAPADPPAARGGGLLALALCLLALGAGRVQAQEPIKDNSFLIEEAYNQERGVVQHISTFAHGADGGWLYTFTQEWPLPDERHQISYTLPVQHIRALATATGFGDAALNYRYQALGIGGGRLAFSPRLSLLVPSGRSRDSLGAGGMGLQANLPVSWQATTRIVTHWNAGVTHTFLARDAADDEAGITTLSLGQSVVFLAHPRFNVLVETLWTRSQAVVGPGSTSRSDGLVVSPGVRWSHDLKSGLQVVPGIAYTVGVGPSHGNRALFLYLSLEHPFRKGGV